MPVRFVLGPAGSGKTHRCLEELRRRERDGRPGIFLVPEQATHASERELLSDPALPGLRHVQVLSFTRLAFRLREEAGMPEPRRIGDAARTMLLRAVLVRLPEETLGPLAPLRARQGFLEELGRFVGEVRAHGTLDFLDAARHAGSEKIRALAAVLEAYDTARRDLDLADPEASLQGLEPLLAAQGERLRATGVFVDGFLSWTRREREVLLALARAGAPMEITLCLEDGERAPFAPAQRSLRLMRGLLTAAGAAEAPPVILAARDAASGRFTQPALVRLERTLHADELEVGEGAPADAGSMTPAPVRIASASDPRREVLCWARIIDRWIRLAPVPVPPERVAVILRDVDPYREAIRETFPAYGIPYYLDESARLLAHPCARLILDALDVLLSGWRRDAVIGFLRNPLLRCEPAAIDLLENLSLEYGRDYEAWYESAPWEVFPPPARARLAPRDRDEAPEVRDRDERPDDGYSDADMDGAAGGDGDDGGEDAGDEAGEGAAWAGGNAGATAADPLARLRAVFAGAEAVRRGVLFPLHRLKSDWEAGSPDGADAALRWRTLEAELTARDRPGAGSATWNDPAPERTERVSAVLDDLLEEAARLWSGVPVTLEEFARALKQGIAAARVPAVPVRFGQVTIAEVQRSRLSGIRRAIVGGLNDGVFPRSVPAGSILDENERRELENAGLSLGPSAEARQEEETWFGYVALTRASDEAVLTFSRRDAQGKALEPSLLVEEVRRVLPGVADEPVAVGTETLGPADLQTPAETADRLAARELPPEPILDELERHLDRPVPPVLGRVRERYERILPALEFHPAEALPADLVRRAIPGPAFETSISRLTEFAKCPYLGFARGVLRLRPRPLAEVTPLETGTLAHAALEAFFRRPRVSTAGAISTTLAEVFQGLRGRPEFRAFEVDRASVYRWDSTRRSLERFLRLETRRLRDAEYATAGFEVRFDTHEGNPVAIPLGEGRVLLLAGRIDRIDRRTRGDETLAVVIDYKRSARSGVRRDIDRGLDLQLVGYLLFAREVMQWTPAGGLYVPVLPSPVPEEDFKRDDANALGLRAAGLFVADERSAIDGGVNLLPAGGPRSGQSVPDEAALADIVDRGRGFLASYAASLLSGWIPARPLMLKPGRLPCENCDYGTLCRFQPARDPVRDEPLDGMPVLPEDLDDLGAPEASPPSDATRRTSRPGEAP